MNLIGEKYRITLIGSSHGKLVGVVIDGVPPGYEISTDKINLELTRRRPGQSKGGLNSVRPSPSESGLLGSVPSAISSAVEMPSPSGSLETVISTKVATNDHGD